MDISSLIDRPASNPPAAGSSSPASSSSPGPPQSRSTSRRNTVHSLLNDDESPVKPRQHTLQQQRKPKKYDTPPIWAQQWTGGGKQQHQQQDHHNPKQPAASSTNSTSNGQKGLESMSGLPNSITGILPFEDLTRKVTAWLYSNMFQLKEDCKYIEVEIKLGEVYNKAHNSRLDLPITTEAVLNPEYCKQNTRFVAQLKDEMFNRATIFLDQECERENSGMKKSTARTRDVSFNGASNQEKLRITFNEQGHQIAKIVKRRVADMMVYSPGDMLDLRVSINTEMPAELCDAISETRPSVRNKNRTSYFHSGMQFDLTAVKQDNAQSSTKEAELELDSQMLNDFMHSHITKSDPNAMTKFEELVRLAVDNARLINRTLSRA